MFKAVLLLPLAAAGLMAAKAPPVTVPAPVSLIAPPAVAANPANRLRLDLSNGGTVVVQLRPDVAPQSVLRIQTLVQQHFYDGLSFHRVIPGFMAQGGDPKGDGTGGAPRPAPTPEISYLPIWRGTMAMARAHPPARANSQFYIMFSPKSSLDHNYTVVGRVISGRDAVDRIAPGEPPADPTKIVHASLGG